MARPLEGIRVLELGNLIAGPFWPAISGSTSRLTLTIAVSTPLPP